MFSEVQIETLKKVADATATNEFFFVTADEGQDLAQAGYIEVDANVLDPNRELSYGCKATDQGIVYLQTLSATPQPATNPFPIQAAQVHITIPEEFEFSVEAPRPRPKKVKSPSGNTQAAGKKSKYPYDTLEIDQNFFVSDASCTSGNAYKTMTSSVAAVNKKYREPKIVGYKPDGSLVHSQLLKDGLPVLDANGHSKYVMVNTRRFRAYKIEHMTANEPVLGARIFREPLKPSDKHAEKE